MSLRANMASQQLRKAGTKSWRRWGKKMVTMYGKEVTMSRMKCTEMNSFQMFP